VADWAPYDRPEAVRALVGPTWQEEREAMLDEVGRYFEEIAALTRAGVPYPTSPWYATPADERRRLIAQAGGQARWTDRL
jgi:chlorite dismutase